MNNGRVQRRRESRKGSCRRNRRQYGGGLGQSYSFGASVDPTNPSLGNAATVLPMSSCGNAVSTGRLTDSGTSGGVPGFGGKQYGGGFSWSPVSGPSPYMDRVYSGCGEGAFATKNTLNDASARTITAPPAIMNPMKGGRRSRKNRKGRKWCGGALPMYGSPVDGMVYEAPRAGYSYGGISGSPPGAFAINQPYAPTAAVSSSCTKTGGRRRKGSRKNSKSRKGSRKNRKSRKGSRKNRKSRKGSRK